MAKNERFEKTYSQGTMNVTEIWVDKETGVNYLYHAAGYSGGLTPLFRQRRKTCYFSDCKWIMEVKFDDQG